MKTSMHADAELPNLDQFPEATAAEKSYAAKYTFIKPCPSEDYPEGYEVWFRVEQQSFRISGAYENEYHASCICWMFAKALLKVKP